MSRFYFLVFLISTAYGVSLDVYSKGGIYRVRGTLAPKSILKVFDGSISEVQLKIMNTDKDSLLQPHLNNKIEVEGEIKRVDQQRGEITITSVKGVAGDPFDSSGG